MNKEVKDHGGMNVPQNERRFLIVGKGHWPYEVVALHLKQANDKGKSIKLETVQLSQSFEGVFAPINHEGVLSSNSETVEVQRVA